MGFGGLSIGHLLVVLVIVLLVFGTKRLKTIGSDLGNAVKGFRSAMAAGEKDDEDGAEPKRIESEPAKSAAAGDVRSQSKPGA